MDHHKDTEYDFYLILNLLVTEKMQLQIDKEGNLLNDNTSKLE